MSRPIINMGLTWVGNYYKRWIYIYNPHVYSNMHNQLLKGAYPPFKIGGKQETILDKSRWIQKLTNQALKCIWTSWNTDKRGGSTSNPPPGEGGNQPGRVWQRSLGGMAALGRHLHVESRLEENHPNPTRCPTTWSVGLGTTTWWIIGHTAYIGPTWCGKPPILEGLDSDNPFPVKLSWFIIGLTSLPLYVHTRALCGEVGWCLHMVWAVGPSLVGKTFWGVTQPNQPHILQEFSAMTWSIFQPKLPRWRWNKT